MWLELACFFGGLLVAGVLLICLAFWVGAKGVMRDNKVNEEVMHIRRKEYELFCRNTSLLQHQVGYLETIADWCDSNSLPKVAGVVDRGERLPSALLMLKSGGPILSYSGPGCDGKIKATWQDGEVIHQEEFDPRLLYELHDCVTG